MWISIKNLLVFHCPFTVHRLFDFENGHRSTLWLFTSVQKIALFYSETFKTMRARSTARHLTAVECEFVRRSFQCIWCLIQNDQFIHCKIYLNGLAWIFNMKRQPVQSWTHAFFLLLFKLQSNCNRTNAHTMRKYVVCIGRVCVLCVCVLCVYFVCTQATQGYPGISSACCSMVHSFAGVEIYESDTLSYASQ